MNAEAMKDNSVLAYQINKDSSSLIKEYKNFFKKYQIMLERGIIDLKHYDLRYFLSCYMTEKSHIKNIRQARFHTKGTLKAAQKVVQYLRYKLKDHSSDEILAELVIPFLECARRYQDIGVGFDKYIYAYYKYELKRHLDEIKLDPMDSQYLHFQQLIEMESTPEEEEEEPVIVMDEGFELSHPAWIHGKDSTGPFSDLSSHERYILAKYYYEEQSDAEIARMLPYHPKSIHRIRMRLIRKFHALYDKGDLKCLRM